MDRKGQEFRRGLASAAFCLAIVGGAGQAWGQAAEEAEADAQGDVVVTGSRIASPNLVQSTPVQSVSSEQLQQQGIVNFVEVMRYIPAAGPNALAPTSAPRDSINSGLFSVDLRGLGSPRTLVLVNGRRHVAGLPGTSIVDLSSIPTDLIERVEVTTGGASAVYGSEAVAGVVNVILDQDFEGLRTRAQYGISERGDGHQFGASLTGGGSFADGRGHAVVFASYDNNGDIIAKDRRISRDLVAVADPLRPDLAIFGPGAFSTQNTIPGIFGLNGATVAASTIRRTVLADGTITTPLNSRDSIDPQQYLFLLNPVERFLVGGNVRFELADDLRLFLDTTFMSAEGLQQIEPTVVRTGLLNIGGFGGLPFTIPVNNPFIPAAIRSLIPATNTTISFGRSFPEFGPRQTDYRRTLFRIVGGVEGKVPLFGSDWRWEAYYQYGLTTQNQNFRGGINNFNLYQAQRVEPNGAGGFRCADAAARATGCIPVNLFTGRPLTAAEQAYIGAAERVVAENEQQVAAVSLTGDLIELPGGPLGIALGGEWRRETSFYRPGDLLSKGLISLQNILPTVGEFSVKEAFIEAKVPLLADLPFVKYLGLEAAYRYADYSTSGGVSAWKVGGTFQPVADVRFRSIYARAVRAPLIAELFQGGTGQVSNVVDPCRGGGSTPAQVTNCATFGLPPGFNPPILTPVIEFFGRNQNLRPEIAKTWTVGGVATPTFLRGASLSFDYFRIRIEGGIGNLFIQTAADTCANTGNVDFCGLFTRDPASGLLLNYNGVALNLAQERMSGFDVEAAYATSLGRLGDRLNLSLNYSHLIEYDVFSFPGADVFDAKGGAFYPADRATLRATYDKGGFNLAITQRFIGKTFLIAGEEFDGNEVSPEWYTDFQARYTFDRRHSLYLGVNNLFDNDPPFFPVPYFGTSQGVNTGATLYDTIGRFFYVGATTKF